MFPLSLWILGIQLPGDVIVLHKVVAYAGCFCCEVIALLALGRYCDKRTQEQARTVVSLMCLGIVFCIFGLYITVPAAVAGLILLTYFIVDAWWVAFFGTNPTNTTK